MLTPSRRCRMGLQTTSAAPEAQTLLFSHFQFSHSPCNLDLHLRRKDNKLTLILLNCIIHSFCHGVIESKTTEPTFQNSWHAFFLHRCRSGDTHLFTLLNQPLGQAKRRKSGHFELVENYHADINNVVIVTKRKSINSINISAL